MRASATPRSLRTAVFTTVRMAHRYPRRPAAIGAGTTTLGLGCQALGWNDPALILLLAGLTALAACTTWWWLRHVARPRTTRALIDRQTALCDRAAGVATALDVIERAGITALRRQATVLRPSLRSQPRHQLRRLDPRAVGVQVARLGTGWIGTSVWSSCEDVTLTIAGPRSGKTTGVACYGLDAPGALVTTSTRLDLAEHLHLARSGAVPVSWWNRTVRRRTRTPGRRPVHFFNPTGYGNVPSTITWRVLSGCTDFDVACRRAEDLIPVSGTEEREAWNVKARALLGLLLHAAAVSGRTMSDVRRWAIGDQAAFAEVRDALLAINTGGRDRLVEWNEHCATNDKTKTSITSTMAAAVAWVSIDRARALGDAAPDDPRLIDIPALITRRETLHLIAGEHSTRTAPLIAALVAEIAHTARMLAGTRPGGRLDPPLTMLLDEADRTVPAALDRWTSDAGGRGITIHICVQSLAQLRARWGDTGAAVIRGNAACTVIYGGSADENALSELSRLVGDRTITETDAAGITTTRRVPILATADIRALVDRQALVLRRGLRPFVGWTPSVLDRPEWGPVTLSRPHPIPDQNQRITTADLEAMFTHEHAAPGSQPDGEHPASHRSTGHGPVSFGPGSHEAPETGGFWDDGDGQ